MNTNPELLYRIALTIIPNIGPSVAKNLLAYCGSAEAVFKASKAKLMKVPSVGEERAEFITQADVLHEAEEELKFISDHHITPLFFSDAAYPYRLKECSDSPLLLYYKGNADLNTEKIIAIVGTRRCTDYGKEVTKKITETLSAHDVLIVSGLAYGIDIAAHNAALENNLKTLGVLGHGLNTLYPQQHKATAKKMAEQGGLLTEYRSTEKMLPHNFPDRNRIVAGLCDALIVIESAEDGGAILTANIANSYNREVFAVPGKATDKWSRGCNALIKSNRAQLIENAEDLLKALNWSEPESNKGKIKKQRQLLLNLNEDEQKIYSTLNEAGELHIDLLIERTQLNSSVLAGVLLEMEMNDIILSLPGKRYKLI
jgi:DNA processing protein